MGFKKGQGGRPKGAVNKTTAVVKEGILCAYRGIGGDGAFEKWAKANPGEFYTKILVKVLPAELQLSGPDGGDIPIKQIVNNYVVPAPSAVDAPTR